MSNSSPVLYDDESPPGYVADQGVEEAPGKGNKKNTRRGKSGEWKIDEKGILNQKEAKDKKDEKDDDKPKVPPVGFFAVVSEKRHLSTGQL